MFTNYGHIENLYQETEGVLVDWRYANLDSVCTVKIDGSNFQVGIDEAGNVSFGTRKNELSPNDNFYNWQKVMEKGDVVNKLKGIKEKLGAKEMTVFGELCGGLYRHPDVVKVPGAARIQGRIDYSPDNEWIVFDILADGKYVNQIKLQELCREFNLPAVEIKFRGTFEECAKVPCEFIDETGHRLWGYPIVEGNVAEGFVIKTVEDVRKPNGERVILKNKNPKYKERIRKTKESHVQGLNELEDEWRARYEEFFNESRAYSAVSKLPANFTFGDFMKAVVEDGEDDFREAYGEELEALERSSDPKDFSFSKARKAALKAVTNVVRPVWLKVMPR